LITIVAAIELYHNNIISAFCLYLTAVLTDFLDGFLARLLRQVSNLGKILDPIADKLTIFSAIIILGIQGKMDW
jgi:cardiolipin synthase